jgi:dienelactone hydrolase
MCAHPDDVPPTRLPQPSGKYDLGTQILRLEREDRDSLGIIKPRKINIQLYYPTNIRRNLPYMNYFYDSTLLGIMQNDSYLNLEDVILKSWAYEKTHSMINAEIAKGVFPVVLFSHGFGMSRINYTAFAEDLASHGYIVVTIDHPGSGLTVYEKGEHIGLIPNPNGPDGKVVEFCEDASYIISELLQHIEIVKHIDKEKIGMMGHSLGGAAALNVELFDPRFKAAVNFDGYPFGELFNIGVKIPFMAILQRPRGIVEASDSMRRERQKEWQSIVDKSDENSFVISIDGFMHFDFSDLPFLIPDSIRVKNGGILKGDIGFSEISHLTLAFFDKYLKGKPIVIKDHIAKYGEMRDELQIYTE